MHVPHVPRIGYPVLVLSLMGLFLVPAHVQNGLVGGVNFESGTLFRVLYALTMLAALVPVARRPAAVIVGVVLAIPVIFTDWVLSREAGAQARLLAYFAFTSFVGANMLRALLSARRADLDTICAAICFYLVAALNWALLYCMLEAGAPGSFNLPSGATAQEKLDALIYYSFVTIASLGYGDILPLREAARAWAAAEVVFGQFFIAIVLARLVSLQIAPPRD